MTRPSANLDKKMIEAGILILTEEGQKGLTLRNVCKKANVNPGMFPYCFGNKDNFISIVYAEIQKRFVEYIDFEKIADKSSIEKLRYILIKVSEYVRKNQKPAHAYFVNCITNYEDHMEKVEKGFLPTNDFMFGLIEKTKEDGFIRKDIATAQIFILLSFGIVTPEFFGSQLGTIALKDESISTEEASEAFFTQRIDIILKGLQESSM